MPTTVSSFSLLLCLAICVPHLLSQGTAKPSDSERARVFITDSQSWEVSGYAGGGANAGAATSHGGARPQTAEIIKTFGERCPDVMVNNIQERADYIVLLDHEGGKSILQHKNKVAVFARISGDNVVSKSTLSLGGSVQEACEAIRKDWAEHATSLHAAAAVTASATRATAPTAAPPAASGSGKISIVSIPDGADIEVDGAFVGNTPSDLQLGDGEHTIAVKKNGFKDWQRKMRMNNGSSVRINAELEKAADQ